MTAVFLSLACLLVLAIQGYSCVRRRTSRRGKPPRDVAISVDRIRADVVRKLAAELKEHARTMRPVRPGLYSASAPAVPRPRPSSRPFIAPGTMPVTSGSSRPASDALTVEDVARIFDVPVELLRRADNLATPMVPISEEPCGNRAPSSDRARTCVRCGRVHHNPCSARVVASSRKQFGMCDYATTENAPGSGS